MDSVLWQTILEPGLHSVELSADAGHCVLAGFGQSPVVDRAKWEKYDGRPCLIFLSVQERLVPKTDLSLELANSKLTAI